jgi:hypothetical protein
VTREPLADVTDFDWRVSIADVAASGPFSTFAGVQRTIVLLEGDAMTLTVGEVTHELLRHVPFTFDGGISTWCDVARGPTRDLNVMCRTGRFRASVQVVEIVGGEAWRDASTSEAEAIGTTVVLALDGELTVAGPGGVDVALAASDAVRWPSPGALEITGSGVAALVRFTPCAG